MNPFAKTEARACLERIHAFEKLTTEVSREEIDRLERAIRAAKKSGFTDKVGFVRVVNGVLDRLGLRILLDDGSLGRLIVAYSRSGRACVQFQVGSGGRCGFGGASFRLVPVPVKHGVGSKGEAHDPTMVVEP